MRRGWQAAAINECQPFDCQSGLLQTVLFPRLFYDEIEPVWHAHPHAVEDGHLNGLPAPL